MRDHIPGMVQYGHHPSVWTELVTLPDHNLSDICLGRLVLTLRMYGYCRQHFEIVDHGGEQRRGGAAISE